MTISSGLYLQQVAPARQDASLQVPLQARSQFDGLQNFFGFLDKGLKTFTDILDTKKAYEQQMAQIAEANDLRAAQLAASGISATDALDQAWQETRYAVPKTWNEVGKQNAVSDLAMRANNGWIEGQASATVLQTALAGLREIKQKGLNGVDLVDLNWINGEGLQQITKAVMPKAEAMIPLGRNGAWVRDQILKQAIGISNDYTERERKRNLAGWHADNKAGIQNLATYALSGQPVPQVLAETVRLYQQQDPEAAREAATEIFEDRLRSITRESGVLKGWAEYDLLQPFMARFGVDLSDAEIDDMITEAVVQENRNEEVMEGERIERASDLLARLPDAQINSANVRAAFLEAGFTPEMLDQGAEDEVLSNNSRIVTSLEQATEAINMGTMTLDAGHAYLFNLTDSPAFTTEWTIKMNRAARANEARSRAESGIDREARRERNDEFKADTRFFRDEVETLTDALYDPVGLPPNQSLTPTARGDVRRYSNNQLNHFRKLALDGVIDPLDARLRALRMTELFIKNLQLNPAKHFQLPPEE